MSIHTDVSPLAVKSFFFAGQKYGQTLHLKPAGLTDEQIVLATRDERVTADFNDCRTYASKLSKLGQEEAE